MTSGTTDVTVMVCGVGLMAIPVHVVVAAVWAPSTSVNPPSTVANLEPPSSLTPSST